MTRGRLLKLNRVLFPIPKYVITCSWETCSLIAFLRLFGTSSSQRDLNVSLPVVNVVKPTQAFDGQINAILLIFIYFISSV